MFPAFVVSLVADAANPLTAAAGMAMEASVAPVMTPLAVTVN